MVYEKCKTFSPEEEEMIKNPKFSIIIPVYNVQNYLSKCLDSVIGQTMKDIEIVCVDDGSKDESYEILNQYSKTDDRIKIIRKTNGGLSSARNAGLRMAKGEYICFLDSDDYVEENFCERIYREILEHRPDIVVFGANVFPLTKDTDPWTYNNLSPQTQQFKSFTPEILLSSNRGYPFVWRNCFKRTFLEKKHLKFDEAVKYGEDTVFQVCAFPGAKNMIYISDKLYNYRYDRKNSLMFDSRRDESMRMNQHLNILKTIYDYWKKAGYLKRWGTVFVAFSCDFVGYDLIKYKGNDKKELIRQLFFMLDSINANKRILRLPWEYKRIFLRLRF